MVVRPCGDHVSKIGRHVQERRRAQGGLVAHGDESDGGADAGAENTEAAVALLFEPAQGAAHVEDGLAVGLHRQADIRADQMIGARMPGNRAAVVIRQAHFDRGDAERFSQRQTFCCSSHRAFHCARTTTAGPPYARAPEKIARGRDCFRAKAKRWRW